jgi:hypothetical protein
MMFVLGSSFGGEGYGSSAPFLDREMSFLGGLVVCLGCRAVFFFVVEEWPFVVGLGGKRVELRECIAPPCPSVFCFMIVVCVCVCLCFVRRM